MRILHIVPTYLPARRYGGTLNSVHGLCRVLVRRGHDVQVLTTSVDGPSDSDVPHDSPVLMDGVRIAYHRSRVLRRLYFSWGLLGGLRNAARDLDVIHLHSVYLWPTLAGAHVARSSRIPYVLSPRGMLVPSLIRQKSRWLKNAWIALFERRNVEGAAAIHVTAGTERCELLKFGFKLAEIAVIPNGIEIDDAAAPTPAANSPVVFLGRLSWKKGLDRLIEAVSLVPGARLEIAGNDEEGLLPVLRRQALVLGVADRVSFLGFVEGEQKRTLLRRAGMLVLPSRSENFGNVVLEAMGAGCPVVVTPDVGLAEAVEKAKAGIVCTDEPAALAEAIRKLLDSEGLRQECGAAGRELVRHEYGWDKVADDYEAMYETVIQRASTGC